METWTHGPVRPRVRRGITLPVGPVVERAVPACRQTTVEPTRWVAVDYANQSRVVRLRDITDGAHCFKIGRTAWRHIGPLDQGCGAGARTVVDHHSHALAARRASRHGQGQSSQPTNKQDERSDQTSMPMRTNDHGVTTTAGAGSCVVKNPIRRAVCIRTRFPDFSPETPITRGHTEPRSMCLDRWELCCLRGIPATRPTQTVSRSRLRTSAGFPPASPFGQLLQRHTGVSHRNTGPQMGEPRSRCPERTSEPAHEEG